MRILLIEDDPGLGQAVRDQIASEGHVPDLATTLAYARDLVAAVGYDLILLDLGLPDGRGLDFLKAMRARGSVTPVIILTAHDRITERIEGLNAGADDYIVKPFDLAELSALQRPSGLPAETEPGALIEHILARYHEVHRAQLPELVRMARRVEAVHREHPQVPAGLADLLEGMHEELLSHMQKEETILFPMLKAGGNPFVGQPITVMRAEHVEHGATLGKTGRPDERGPAASGRLQHLAGALCRHCPVE